MTVYAAGNSKFYIGGAFADTALDNDLTEASFTSQSWVQIKRLEGLGTLGAAREAINYVEVETYRQKTLRGPANSGTMDVICLLDPTDPGQLAVIAAEKTGPFDPENFAFKLEMPDGSTSGTPSMRMFAATVLGAAEQFDQANNIMKLNITLAINSNIVRKAAAAGGGG